MADQTTPSAGTALPPAVLRVLRDLAAGYTSKQIATRHYISPSCVAQHIHRANQRLGTRTAVQAVVEAHRRGLLDPTTQELTDGR